MLRFRKFLGLMYGFPDFRLAENRKPVVQLDAVLHAIPEVVTLCGSTRFKAQFEAAVKRLTLEGKIVLSVGLFGYYEGLDMSGPIKQELDALHKCKIDISDRILVLNVCGYIGESTRSEIEYAQSIGVPVDYLEPIK